MRHLLSLLLISLFSLACQPQTVTREVGQPAFAAPPQAGAAPWTHLNFARQGGDFRFAVMADRNGGCRPGVFEKAVQQLNLLQPEFVMCVGDLVEGYCNKPGVIQPQYDEMDGILAKLQAPFFRTVGNHDVSAPDGWATYIARYGQPYYHFTYGNVLFLVLNSEDNMSLKQVEYIKTTLQQNKDVRWTFLFMHQPLFTKPSHPTWPKVEELLKDRPFTVFAGHDHVYRRHVINGREHLVLSTTGGGNPLRGLGRGEFEHTVWVTMTDKGPKIANLLMDGVHDTTVRTDSDAALVEGARVDIGPLLVDALQSGPTSVDVSVVNDTDATVTADVRFESHPMLACSVRSFTASVPAHSVKRVPVTISMRRQVPMELVTPLRGQATIRLSSSKSAGLPVVRDLRIVPTRTQTCPRAAAPISVDGKLDDWGNASWHDSEPAQILGDSGQHAGVKDGRFRFATAQDKEWFYLAVEVEDDKLFLPLDRAIWEQDGLEVRLCALPEPRLSCHYNDGVDKDVTVLMFSPGKSEDKPYIWPYMPSPKGTRIACVKTAKGYVAEVAIPASHLDAQHGSTWKALRLNVAMNDFDGPKQRGAQLWWAPDWRTSETYSGSGLFLRK